MRLPTSCSKLQISFANDIVHRSQNSLLGCLVSFWYSIALHVSSSMVSISYPIEVVCAVFSICIATSKRFRHIVSARVSTWCFGAACVF